MADRSLMFWEAMAKIAEHIRTDTHTRPDGTKINVNRLWDLVKTRKPVETPLDQLHPSTSKRSGFSKKRMEKADTSFPVILGPDEDPYIDGRHRILKSKAQGKTTIMAHKLSKQDLDSAHG